MIKLNYASSIQQAIDFGNRLMQADIIQHVERDHTFKNEKLYYRFTEYYYRSTLQNSMNKTQPIPTQTNKVEIKEEDSKMSNDTQPTPKQVPSGNSSSQVWFILSTEQ